MFPVTYTVVLDPTRVKSVAVESTKRQEVKETMCVNKTLSVFSVTYSF